MAMRQGTTGPVLSGPINNNRIAAYVKTLGDDVLAKMWITFAFVTGIGSGAGVALTGITVPPTGRTARRGARKVAARAAATRASATPVLALKPDAVKIIDAVRNGKTAVDAVASYTGFSKPKASGLLRKLSHGPKRQLFMAGANRFARYGITKDAATLAAKAARTTGATATV